MSLPRTRYFDTLIVTISLRFLRTPLPTPRPLYFGYVPRNCAPRIKFLLFLSAIVLCSLSSKLDSRISGVFQASRSFPSLSRCDSTLGAGSIALSSSNSIESSSTDVNSLCTFERHAAFESSVSSASGLSRSVDFTSSLLCWTPGISRSSLDNGTTVSTSSS